MVRPPLQLLSPSCPICNWSKVLSPMSPEWPIWPIYGPILIISSWGWWPFWPIAGPFAEHFVVSALSTRSNFRKDAFCNKFGEITMCRAFSNTYDLLIFRVPNPAPDLDMLNSLPLTVTQSKTGHYFLCQPIPPECHYKMRPALLEVRLRQAGLPAIRNHVGRAGSGLLDVLHPEQRLGDQWVLRNRAMRFPQEFRSQAGR